MTIALTASGPGVSHYVPAPATKEDRELETSGTMS